MTELDESWASELIRKYEYEHDTKVKEEDLEDTLRNLMYEKGFECSEERLAEILENF
jgi:hypothetical protein